MINTINNVKDPNVALIAVLDKLVSPQFFRLEAIAKLVSLLQNSPIIIKNYVVEQGQSIINEKNDSS